MKVLKKAAIMTAVFLALYAPAHSRAADSPTTSGTEILKQDKRNVNSATSFDLQQVKGIGPKKAEKILQYLEEKGPVGSTSDLINVKGVGPKTLEKIQEKFRAD